MSARILVTASSIASIALSCTSASRSARRASRAESSSIVLSVLRLWYSARLSYHVRAFESCFRA